MGKVLKADASAADAYVDYDLPATHSEAWLTYGLSFHSSALAFWTSTASGDFSELQEASGNNINAPFLTLSGGNWWHDDAGYTAGGPLPVPVADTWLTCESHWKDSVITEFYVNGTLAWSAAADSRLVGKLLMGQIFASPDIAAVAYIKDVKLGTTRGGTDLFADDFSSGTLAAWTSTSGAVSVIDDPFPSPASVGICVAFGYDAFDTAAVFTRIDDPLVPGLTYVAGAARSVKSWSSDRGRAYELDKTQTGTAQIVLLDDSGIFDPTNAASPLYGKITPMMRAVINVQNPSDLSYHDIFTGFIESWEWTFTGPDEKLMEITIGLVDGFEPLARGEIQPQASGTTVFVGDAASTACQTRLNAILDLAGWPTDGLPGPSSRWRNINTGNVKLQRTVYNPQTSFLAAMQDVADAEFPGVANVFINKKGAVTFYGRYPRFQPSNYPDDVQLWQAADKAGLAPADGAALISDITWALDSKNLINASLCTPFGITQTDILGQLVTDTVSIGQYGIRTLSLPDLIVDGQNAATGLGSQPAATANEVCVFYGQYYVDNYAQPELRISRLEFHSRNAGDSQTWGLITGVEIGDLISVWTSNPGGGGFGKQTFGEGVVSQFFVEGIHNVVAGQLHENVPDWTMTLDVSPRGWFTTAPFGS